MNYSDIGLFWQVVPAAVIAAIVTFTLNRFGSSTDRKLKYRTFLDVDEVNAQYKLRDMPNLKSGTKLVTTDDYKLLDKEIKKKIALNDFNSTATVLNYLKVRVVGESIITSGTVNLILRRNDDSETWPLKISLPILQPNEEIYIPTNRVKDLGNKYHIQDIEVNYRTQSGESMCYKSVRKRSDLDNEKSAIITNSYKVKKFNLYHKAIDKNVGRNASWIFLDNDKNKEKS